MASSKVYQVRRGWMRHVFTMRAAEAEAERQRQLVPRMARRMASVKAYQVWRARTQQTAITWGYAPGRAQGEAARAEADLQHKLLDEILLQWDRVTNDVISSTTSVVGSGVSARRVTPKKTRHRLCMQS